MGLVSVRLAVLVLVVRGDRDEVQLALGHAALGAVVSSVDGPCSARVKLG